MSLRSTARFVCRHPACLAVVLLIVASGLLHGAQLFFGPGMHTAVLSWTGLGLGLLGLLLAAHAIIDLQKRVASVRRGPDSLKRLQDIIESLDAVVWSGCPATGSMLYMSQGAETLYGYKVEDFYRNPRLWFEAVHPEDRERTREFTTLLTRHGQVQMEYRIVRSDGAIRWVRDSGRVIRDDDGNVIRHDGILVDITKQVEQQRQLEQTENRVRQILAGAPVVLLSVDRDGVLDFVGGRGLEHLSAGDQFKVGRRIWDIIGENQSLVECWTNVLNGNTFTTINEFEGLVFETNFLPILDMNGKVSGGMAIATDITARQVAEEALRESEERFRRLARSTNEGVAIHRNGRILDANARFADMLGEREEDLFNRELHESVKPESTPSVSGREAFISRDSYECRFFARDGHEFLAELTDRPVRYRGEDAIVTTIRDVTEQREMEKQIWRAKLAAEEAARAKTSFLANMSHEIRTPLNAIIGVADLLTLTRLDQQQTDYLRVVRSSGESLLTILNAILDFSKIDAGRLELESAPFDLSRLLSSVGQLFEFQASRKRISFRVDAPTTFPHAFVGDSARLRQVLFNLVGNAIKFTEEGSVVLHVRDVPRTDGHSSLRFEVTDTGIGIPPHLLNRLFKPFSQVDSSTTRRFGGTGLGLAISQQLVEAMGGAITCHSMPGKGTTFAFAIDLAHGDAGDIPEPERASGEVLLLPSSALARARRPYRVLVAEDNPTNQLVLCEMLRRLGLGYTCVETGAAAVDAYHADQPDVILMDCQMPEVDGFEATRMIRRLEANQRRLPIIAVTANALAGDRERCIAAGMDDYLAKPITLGALQNVLSRFLDFLPAETQTDEAAKGTQPAPDPPSLPTMVPLPNNTGNGQEPVLFDPARLRAIDGGDRTFMNEILNLFLADTASRLEATRQAVEQSDADRIRREAHTIKGASANIGAMALREAAFALETAARDGDSSTCGELLARVTFEFQRLGEHLRETVVTP